MKKLALLLAASFVGWTSYGAPLTGALKTLAVQDGGRLKPFDSFSRETLRLIYGKEKYEGRPAYEILYTWILQPDLWKDKEIFEITHADVKRGLHLEVTKKYFSLNEVMGSDRLPLLMQELNSKRETKEKLDPYFQALQRLENQIFDFREVVSGKFVKLFPPKDGTNWRSLAELTEAETQVLVEMSQSFSKVVAVYTNHDASQQEQDQVQSDFAASVEKVRAAAQASNPSVYPSFDDMKLEVHYNDFHPFQKAWIFYLLAVICVLLFWVLKKERLVTAAWILALVGMGFHIYGFAIRCYLTGRPPVSNMYETVVWVGFGTLLFAMIIEAIYKLRFTLLAGTAVASFCLILADNAPVILDNGLHPLEPVLRSNLWLMIHVLTITISYSAYFLAFALGDMALYYYLRGEDQYKDKLAALGTGMYRAMQIGVVLLATGTILGGVWADYSWGRFWGWDPKETWALIALLGYLAVLHGRLAGWLKQFGLAAASVVTFSLVIMAWYGVNFVLGAGLHSYGFGAGGVEYVIGFVALHLIYVIFVGIVRQGRLREKKT